VGGIRDRRRKLQNQDLHDLVLLTKYYHVNKIKENEKGGASSMYGGSTRTYRMLTGASEGKGPNGRPRRRCKVILKWIFKK
jgi:hypothetical protein